MEASSRNDPGVDVDILQQEMSSSTNTSKGRTMNSVQRLGPAIAQLMGIAKDARKQRTSFKKRLICLPFSHGSPEIQRLLSGLLFKNKLRGSGDGQRMMTKSSHREKLAAEV